MKIKFNILSVVVIFLMFANTLQSQPPTPSYELAYSNLSSASANTTVKIIETVAAYEVTPLQFGRFLPESSKSSVAISPEGNRMVSGRIGVKDTPFSPAKYYFSGENAICSSINIPNTPTVLYNFDNSKSLLVSDWNIDNGVEIKTNDSTIGNHEVNLGATLFISDENENPVGYYKGDYQLTIIYN